MNDKQSESVEDILSKIEEFEKTISTLSESVRIFKLKILEKKQRYGSDMTKWPDSK